MKKPIILTLGILATFALAQSQSKPQLTDKNGRFALWFQEASTEFPDKSTIVFDVSGNPAHGYSREQNLEFAGQNMTGRVRKLPDGALLLTKGALAGGATLTVTDSGGTSKFESAKVTIDDDGDKAVVSVPGAFTYTNSSSTQDGKRQMVAKGTGGTFNLKSLKTRDEHPLVSSNIDGPVTVSVYEVGAGGKTKLYGATADHATMRSEGADMVLVATGNVKLTSEETGDQNPGFMGEMTVSSATVVFDESYHVKSIKTKGPGVGKVTDKKGGT